MMSSQGTKKEVDPTELVSTVLEKTKAGKLNWEETADDHVFIAMVGGSTMLQVRESSKISFGGGGDSRTLSLLDGNGNVLWETTEPPNLIQDLFKVARRMALQVDEKVEAFLDTLQKL